MSSSEERAYIADKLIPELVARFEEWGAEYKQPRELGLVGEFVGLHRKVGKLKTIVWDRVDASGWREDPRTILQEVVAHGLLMLYDMDHGDDFTSRNSRWDDEPLSFTEHVREMDEQRKQKRPLGVSLPLSADHTYTRAPGDIVGHLAHPGVDCRAWEEMRDSGKIG